MDFQIRKKRLIYRAFYRGSKEADIMMRKFIDWSVDKFQSEDGLSDLEAFVKNEDAMIYDLAFGRVQPLGLVQVEFVKFMKEKV